MALTEVLIPATKLGTPIMAAPLITAPPIRTAEPTAVAPCLRVSANKQRKTLKKLFNVYRLTTIKRQQNNILLNK